jgi:DNA-binding CsgD family transcriptional regulator/tetratricopeptide (TPR) repeat protein
MLPVGRPRQWVGRAGELATVGSAIGALREGTGSVVWVEGEPGIGKSSLVAEALADSDPQWDIGWGMADPLAERVPLQVILDCLQVRMGSPDPARAHAAELMRARQLAGSDASAAGSEILAMLVDEVCAAAPTVLVIDDLQWADEASLVFWHQLAISTRQLRLLLIGTCRPTPHRRQVQQVRTALARRGGAVITLGPLSETDVASLVTAVVGAPPGDALRQLTARAAGNPLYVREMVDALVREHAVQVSPTAGADLRGGQQLPASLAGVLTDRLSSVSAETARLLRAAVLFGGRFGVSDLAVVLRQPASDLAASLQEAIEAGILAGSGTDLIFRHPLIGKALYEGMPMALRTALHAEAARELATARADAASVAQQLFASGRRGEGWILEWLLQAAPALCSRAPQLAVELLQREADAMPVGGARWDVLMIALVEAQLAAGARQEAARRASWALKIMTDPTRRAEAYWALAHTMDHAGRPHDLVATIREALAAGDMPVVWRARMLTLLALGLMRASGLDAADLIARQALAAAEEAADPYATGQALINLWMTCSIRRDHAGALAYIDRALRALGDDPGNAGMVSNAFGARIFTLQNLDQWPQAVLALQDAREFAQRTDSPDRQTWAAAAVLRYWLGQWDDAIAELGPDTTDAFGVLFFVGGRPSALLTHGVAALIAGRRDQSAEAGEQLRQGLAVPIESMRDREGRDFLIAAHALSLEQRGETAKAAASLAAMLPRGEAEMTLTHQWMPDLVRLALAIGDPDTALVAARACEAEAAAETRSARAAAASLRCRGLLEADPGPLLEAVDHYRAAGPAVELAAAVEDLAVVLAGHGREADARAALDEAVSLYEGMQAQWDIRRAEGRLRAHGIRRGLRGRRSRRAATGWAALTPTEVKIATLITQGDSTADVAQRMYLSRRTVQTYISHILAKLDAKSRLEIVREAQRQGVSP